MCEPKTNEPPIIATTDQKTVGETVLKPSGDRVPWLRRKPDK